MALTNFPNGVASFGMPVIANVLANYGCFGVIKFVCNRSTGRSARSGKGTFDAPYSTLAAALADGEIRANSGDAIVVLPGHSESVANATMLTSLLDGVSIFGFGQGSNMPTFRWTATTSQWVLDNANTVIRGLRLRLEGANGVVKALVWTGADNILEACDIETASGATAKATIALEVGAAADRLKIRGNKIRGTATHNSTDIIKVAGVADQVEIVGNDVIASATAGNGCIHITAAATNILIKSNTLNNTHTSSTATIAIDDVAATGFIVEADSALENDGTITAQGAVFAGTTPTIKCSRVYAVDQKAKNSTLSPAAGT